MLTCKGLDALILVEAVEIAQVGDSRTGEFKNRLIVRARTRKLAKEFNLNFFTFRYCPACGSPTEQGVPMCAEVSDAH